MQIEKFAIFSSTSSCLKLTCQFFKEKNRRGLNFSTTRMSRTGCMTCLLFMESFCLLCLYKTLKVNFGENAFSPRKLSINIQRENVPRANYIPGRKSTGHSQTQAFHERFVRIYSTMNLHPVFLVETLPQIFLLERGHTLTLCK